MSDKVRLDVYLHESGMCESREKAKAIIMSGQVYIDDVKYDKAGAMIPADSNVVIRGDGLKYVSRGGLKLEKAMQVFPIKLDGKICMDIGASTGGFTDCMLQNGAKKVFSVDVGYGQLAWKLRNDERVVNMERTNIRYVTKDNIKEELNFASVDVSFISLALVLPVAFELLKTDGEAVALIKPQFEAGREQVGKKGVVRDKNVHIDVIKKIVGVVGEIGFNIAGLDFSPVKGPEGNIEYLIYLKKTKTDFEVSEDFIENLVLTSHEALK